MELTKHFDNLLTDTINLPKWRLEQLPERVETLYGKLRLSDSVGQLVTGKTPQGSWAHRTIIKPLPGLEYDADVLIHMKENESWDTTKAKYLDVIDRALESAGYAHRQAKTRCVRVSYANECHVDLVPYVLTSDGYHIVNAETGEWEDTNPEGFTAWMRERDDITNGNFRKVVRIMKFLRDHRASFTDVPSIILTTMMGNRISHDAEYGDPRAYQNVPKTLVTVVDALDVWLQDNPLRPSIEDPSSPGTTFDHRWKRPETYSQLRKSVNVVAAEMRGALTATDYEESLARWQGIFGDGFKGNEPKESSSPFAPLLVGGTSVSRSGRGG